MPKPLNEVRACCVVREGRAAITASATFGYWFSCACTPCGLCGHPAPYARAPHQMQPAPDPCSCVLVGAYRHPAPYDGESHHIQDAPWLSCLWWREGLKGQLGPKDCDPQYTHALIAQPSSPAACLQVFTSPVPPLRFSAFFTSYSTLSAAHSSALPLSPHGVPSAPS
jgi:hypothetical protein